MGPSAPRNILRRTWLGIETRAMRHLLARAHRRSILPEHLLTGERGELEAIFYLRRHGYTIVARRWRNAKLRGDLDIIAWDGPTLCFIEVKTRSRTDAIPAEAAVDHDKRQTLRRLAQSYMRRLPEISRESPARLDVLSLYLPASEHLPAPKHLPASRAFPASESSPYTDGPATYIHKNPGPHVVLYKGAFSWA
jgi:putative endonuclease